MMIQLGVELVREPHRNACRTEAQSKESQKKNSGCREFEDEKKEEHEEQIKRRNVFPRLLFW